MQAVKFTSIEQYLNTFPKEIAAILTEIQNTISQTAPGAEECISYNMPAFKLHKKPLVYFAAFKNHIGFYALPSGNAAFHKEMSRYKSGKGSVQFPLDQKIPYDLIRQIVEFRVHEVTEAIKSRK